MRLEDVFPYDKNEYSFVINFFNRYVGRDFPEIFSYWAKGDSAMISDYAGINIPLGEDEEMVCGPTIFWGYDPSTFPIDFHEFAVIILTVTRVFLENMREKGITEYYRYINLVDNTEHIFTEERFLGDIENFRKNFLDVRWIKENCYGEDDVCDNNGVMTGEHHGKEWGEEWYEKYGKHLNFDDVDKIIEESFAAYYRKKRV